jgi:hypothetical protein
MVKLEYGPMVRDLELGLLLAKLMILENSIIAFYNDPMTEAYGIGSEFTFIHDFARRKVICNILNRARKVKDNKAETFALELLEEWMP